MATVMDDAAIILEIDTRRVSTLRSIKQADPRMKDDKFRADRLALVEEHVFRHLFENGHNDPKFRLGADYVAWLVDQQLSEISAKKLGKPFPFANHCPDSGRGPSSGKLERYKTARLAKEAAEKLVEHFRQRLEQKGKTTAASLHPAKKIRRHTGVDTDDDGDDDKTVNLSQPTAVVAPREQVEQEEDMETAKSLEHESSPVRAVTKRKRPTMASDTEELPESGDGDVDVLRLRLALLCTKDLPDASQGWPKIMWEAMYEAKPLEHGDYFALPICDDWLPLVSPEVLATINRDIDPRIRVAVHEPAELGKPRRLAVSFSETGNPHTSNNLCIFGDVWGRVQLWHRYMVEGVASHPLDQSMAKMALHRAQRDFYGHM